MKDVKDKINNLEKCLKDKDKRISKLEQRWNIFRCSFFGGIAITIIIMLIYSIIATGINATLFTIKDNKVGSMIEKELVVNGSFFPFIILVLLAIIGCIFLIVKINDYIIEMDK